MTNNPPFMGGTEFDSRHRVMLSRQGFSFVLFSLSRQRLGWNRGTRHVRILQQPSQPSSYSTIHNLYSTESVTKLRNKRHHWIFTPKRGTAEYTKCDRNESIRKALWGMSRKTVLRCEEATRTTYAVVKLQVR